MFCADDYYPKSDVYIIKCNKRMNIQNFKNVSFILDDIKFVFTSENNYIFSIVFGGHKHNNISYWILGKVFMKKYQLFFDLERKIVGMYMNNYQKNNIGLNAIFFLLLIFFAVVIFILSTIIVYLLKKQRKYKAIELNDINNDYLNSK